MATFYYDRESNEDVKSQWSRYLKTEAKNGSTKGIVEKTKSDLQIIFSLRSSSQIKAGNYVLGSLDGGLGEVNRRLEDINFNISELRGEINAMASMLDWKLSLMIEEQRLTNQLLANISELLRIPDSQKQRVYHIEQGLKYLKNAVIENIDSPFYIDALENFKEAEKIERKDYITLNKIGLIYLYSEKHFNFAASEEYFLKSAREAFAEHNAGGTTTSNYLKASGNDQSIYSRSPYKIATAEAYLYAGRACYLQKKFSEAADFAGKAFVLVPEFTEAGFEQAKYYAADDHEIEAAKTLENVINKDRYFWIKTLTDEDLASKQTILELLEKFRRRTTEEAALGLEQCRKLASPQSNAKGIIDEVEELVKTNGFLSGMKALDILKATHEFILNTGEIKKGKNGRSRVVKTSVKTDITDFLKKENLARENAKNLNNNSGCGMTVLVLVLASITIVAVKLFFGE